MLKLVLYATLPVLVTAVVAGLVAPGRGPAVLWGSLGGGLVVTIIVWALQPGGGSIIDRVVAPIFVYLPPLVLAGLVLHRFGSSGLSSSAVLLVALAAAGSNILLAPVFLTVGALAGLWDSM